MTDFFEYSQGIKALIERNSEVMKNLEKHMIFGHGKIVAETPTDGIPSWQHYSLGQLENGLWVVAKHRLHAFEDGESPEILTPYERFAMFSEEMASKGTPITKFCVGAGSGRHTTILIEDLTQGGAVDQIDLEGKLLLKFTHRKHPYNFRELRYMHVKNRIQFEPVPEYANESYDIKPVEF